MQCCLCCLTANIFLGAGGYIKQPPRQRADRILPFANTEIENRDIVNRKSEIARNLVELVQQGRLSNADIAQDVDDFSSSRF